MTVHQVLELTKILLVVDDMRNPDEDNIALDYKLDSISKSVHRILSLERGE